LFERQNNYVGRSSWLLYVSLFIQLLPRRDLVT